MKTFQDVGTWQETFWNVPVWKSGQSCFKEGIKMIRKKNFSISGPLIKEKALGFANRLGHVDFQANSGWLDKFKKRLGIKEKTV